MLDEVRVPAAAPDEKAPKRRAKRGALQEALFRVLRDATEPLSGGALIERMEAVDPSFNADSVRPALSRLTRGENPPIVRKGHGPRGALYVLSKKGGARSA